MGREITTSSFTREDFAAFGERLARETALLQERLRSGGFSEQGGLAGAELEAWLVNGGGFPAPVNVDLLAKFNNALVVPELAQFNVELNVAPQTLHGDGLVRLQAQLDDIWRDCDAAASSLGARMAMVGILPTLRDTDLTLDNMSAMQRYAALNEQVLRARRGKPLHLNIIGRERLESVHYDVMLESAATSLQLHLQVSPAQARRVCNASMVAAGPMVALAANSPFLFGRDLWEETRIPVFEQAVEVGGYAGAAQGPVRRVTFGSDYIHDSIGECYRENLEHYPVLLPMLFDEPPEMFSHLRLHNGSIWRWNRPLVGFDADGTPHLRIEHRVMPAGPTVIDMLANAAFYYGLVNTLAERPVPPELQLPFSAARDNFYNAARYGLDAQILWLDGERTTVQQLIIAKLLPLARRGLERLEVSHGPACEWLEIIAERVRSGRTGAAWQRDFVAAVGPDMQMLTQAYLENQRTGTPVHAWRHG